MCIPGEMSETARLPWAERVVLWSVRAWVVGFLKRTPVDEAIRAVYAKAGIPEAAGLIDPLMSIVASSATRSLEIDCVCQKSVSDDERDFIELVALVQAQRRFEAMLVLRSFMTPEGAVSAIALVERLAGHLSAAQLRLTPARAAIERFSLASVEMAGASVGRTIH